ncbi:MAG: hypothetical protein A2288_03425 [Candidatus Moranbacteria bacterium RIFOXYA12_FULL_44_15]|nr:MAG: hypothetical protein A2288_03425 [Candidatus Moranbacteria bacterium RIFOXYA12_FULL_44_15]OGI34928.1 MAG: hypothetical protein A2259_03645 [Candidatus Moranbacteria bacterium RIFOXYA2_FULL_43_15]
MFDIRPVDEAGGLDFEKIRKVRRVVKVKPEEKIRQEIPKARKYPTVYDVKRPDVLDRETERFRRELLKEKMAEARREPLDITVSSKDQENISNISVSFSGVKEYGRAAESVRDFSQFVSVEEPCYFKESPWKEEYLDDQANDSEDEFFLSPEPKYKAAVDSYPDKFQLRKMLLQFSGASLAVAVLIMNINFISRGFQIKNLSFMNAKGAYASLSSAKESVISKDFHRSSSEFGEAYRKFGEISDDLKGFGGVIIESSRFLPYLSKLSSGKHLAEAGKDISRVGILSSQLMETLEGIKKPAEPGKSVSYLEVFQKTNRDLQEISNLLKDTQSNLDQVNADDVPEEQRAEFVELKSKLPETNEFLESFCQDSRIFTDILGGNGPRKYLFLFQNNQEMRSTGGFIGTYAVLDIFNGRVRNFFIDGIFNPDGQLKEKVVPPAPIQKISATWSLHDSNWFPDFPVSAEKASWFYEKTGGPTVDGVITMTPTVMQKLLEVTGPIEMPEYGVTVDKDNFIEKIQYEVEVDYDKELNQPKKILADLAPLILDRIFNAGDFSDLAKTAQILLESLDERHILLYSSNYEIEKIISARGWSGEVLEAKKDYLMVVNSNINGYKTDGVIDEKIEHRAEIQPDGSIVDNVKIIRHHNGGNSEHDFWNKVNADYVRVYVPKGSRLLNAEGQTREFNSPPLDYDILGFKRDPQVKMEEDSMEIDAESGTRIYEDAGKTVFANWAYVSPQETVEIKYSYVLPFKIDTDFSQKPADTYSILFQKQAGSLGSKLGASVTYPKSYNMIWKYPEKESEDVSGLPDGIFGVRMETDLSNDRFFGMAFSKE